jgi:hypothetical protein
VETDQTQRFKTPLAEKLKKWFIAALCVINVVYNAIIVVMLSPSIMFNTQFLAHRQGRKFSHAK